MRSSTLFIVALAAFHGACGGGHAPSGTFTPPSGKSYVVWPISNGTVTAYRFDGNTRGAAVGSATTDGGGAFELRLTATATDQVLLVVSSGSYLEPATGTPISMDSYELTALLAAAPRLPGDSVTGALISPVSHLVAQLSANLVTQGRPPDAALSKANTLLNAHFGGIDWRTLSTAPDLSSASSSTIVQLNDSSTAGLILAGLSMEARNLAQAKALTPGGPLNSLSLLAAIAADIGGDHYFDGQDAPGARLSVPPSAASAYALDGQTVRATLAQGISNFLSSNRNSSRVAQADAQALITAIATDGNPELFREPGGNVDLTPPAIAFVQPAANASVHGQVTIEASATDDNAMGTFTFSAPSALTASAATLESPGRSMRLKTILDVSAMPDGPLIISVAASDAALNTATQNLTVRVANHGPVVNVSSPTSSERVRGAVTISATANGQNGATVTGLTLVDPPAGTSTDTLPAADSLSMTWDSTKTLEGPVTLHFHGTDNFGGVTDTFVTVIVDNVPFGVVTTHVSAGGNPISGATIAVVAVDNATGQPIPSIGINGQLGQCSSTDTTGTLACTLTSENYQGPIQVTAGGPGLSYTDPSDGLTVISIPQTFRFTSYIANYKTGDAVTVPLTLWTTLNDQVALAYLAGVDRAAAAPHSLVDSLIAIDPLFAKHVTSTPWDVRATVPVSLTTSAQSLRDVVYAALPDVALNQIARDKSAAANVTPGGVITAVTLTQLLVQDARADGQFDGLGSSRAQLQASGNPAQPLDASWLRYEMAKGLDEWFQTTQNKTGLLSSDLQNAGVFDTVASDTSMLFPSNVIPPVYDNAPPTVTIGTTFTNGGTTSGPVIYASQKLVAGALHLSVRASDPSGVQSTTVFYRGAGVTSWTTLVPGSGSTPSSVTGEIDTTKLADGTMSIAVSTTDKLGNNGSTTVQYVVDNTLPSITVAQPAAANLAYAASVPSNIVVSDDEAVASVAEVSLGVSLSQSSAGAWTGFWPIPASQADGLLALTYKSCDLVFNCRKVGVPFFVDRTPPVVNVNAAPPQNTNVSMVSLTATASDGSGSGVASVVARNLTTQGPEMAGTYDSNTSTWTISGIALGQNQVNNIVVYAIDRALDGAGNPRGNSGAARAPPYQVSVQSLFDKTPPTISLSTTQAPSYYDERGMKLAQVGSSPNLTSAWAYDPSATRNANLASVLQVDTSAAQIPIHKTTQRLALGTTLPDLTDLLNSRGSSTNTPYLSFTVPFAASTDAPVVSASYTASVTCPGCPAFPDTTGQLVADTNAQPAGTRWLLPIATEFIPALGQVTSLATVSVQASATDKAGNPGARTLVATFRFALDAPPIVAFVEDTNYRNENDPWAVTSYLVGNGTYANSFAAPGPAVPAEGERLVKYVVYNAGASYGLTVQLTNDPSDGHPSPVVENWEGWDDMPFTPAYPNSEPWCFGCGAYANPCPGYAGYLWQTNPSTGGVRCPSIAHNPSMTYAPVKMSSAPLTLRAYRAGSEGTTIAGDAAVAGNGAYVIPASSNGYMGVVFVYVGRIAATVTRFNLLGAPGGASFQWNSASGKYESGYATVPQPPTSTTRIDCTEGLAACYDDLADWNKQLDSAQSNVYGSLGIAANGFASGTTNSLGASTAPTTIRLTRVIGQ